MRKIISSLLAVLLLAGCQTIEEIPSSLSTNKDERKERADLEINLAMGYLRNGDRVRASQAINRAIEISPEYGWAYNAMGLVQEALGDPGAAEAAFRRSVELDPARGDLRNNYAIFLCREKRYREADAQFRAALADKLYDEIEVALTNAGNCARKLPDLGLAELYYRKAVKRNPRFPPALLQMAKVSLQVERYSAVPRFLNQYWALSPKSADTLFVAFRAEQGMGNQAKADEYLAQLRRDFPNAPQLDYIKR